MMHALTVYLSPPLSPADDFIRRSGVEQRQDTVIITR